MKKTIGILYICTGPYYLFWKDFYKSFEKNFLPNYEKKYFVFTDAETIYGEEKKNVFKFNLDPQPWPLITLLRFSTFLKAEEQLKKCDYLMFSNANMICEAQISEEEFLPREDKGEELFFTIHPGYSNKFKIKYPYDRNKKSHAYIPYNCGKKYVIGAMFGGKSEAFIKMSKTLKANIEEDLKNNVIAKWHDESHINHYIIGKSNIRYLSSEYCYPYGMNVDYERKISAVSKQAKFDVKSFKGQYDQTIISKIFNKLKKELCVREVFHLIVDTIMIKKVKHKKDEE